MSNSPNNITTAGNFNAGDIINPVALAKKLHAGDHAFSQKLAEKFTPPGQAVLATSANGAANPKVLAPVLAEELNAIVAGGLTLYDPACVNGTKLRKSTRKLIKKSPQGAELVRLNTLLVQDYFSDDLMRDSCELVEVVKKKGIEFRIYRERRKLKTMWSESYRISFPAADGTTSTQAPSLADACVEIDTLAERVLAGQAPVTKKENKERDAKAQEYEKITLEFARLGMTDRKGILKRAAEFIDAQLLLGIAVSLPAFIINAIELLVKPVTPCTLKRAAAQYKDFVMSRNEIGTKVRRGMVSRIERFTEDMCKLWNARILSAHPAAGEAPLFPPPPEIHVHEVRANDIQTWINGRKIKWNSRRDELDTVRAFFKYCQDALHAVPPGKTAAQVVPRPKPNSNAVSVPVTVLSFTDIWRLLINLQDLESVFFVALGVFAGLHGEEIGRLLWKDIIWKDGLAIQILVPPGSGKNRGGKRIAQHVTVRHPLNRILALGQGRTGHIVSRRFTRQDKVTPIVNRLQIAWDESIMRHSFASNLFGIGFSFAEVAKEMRNTETVLRKHYYAPIPLPVAEQYWTIPVDISIFAPLPSKRRFWNWSAPLRQFPPPPQDGGAPTEYPPFPPTPKTPSKSTVKKNRARIAWPDDLELLVLLWEKPQKLIARDFHASSTSVSAHAKARGLKPPSFNYWFRVNHGISAEVPEVVIKARAELLARQKAAAAKAAQDSPPSTSTPSATEDHNQKPTSGPENPESGDHANPSEPHGRQPEK